MKIDVGYVAELARLELSEDEMKTFQPQLEDIVGYVEKIILSSSGSLVLMYL